MANEDLKEILENLDLLVMMDELEEVV